MSYLPSTLAAATMIRVIKEIESFNATEYIDQLLGLLKISEVCLLKLCWFCVSCKFKSVVDLVSNWKNVGGDLTGTSEQVLQNHTETIRLP